MVTKALYNPNVDPYFVDGCGRCEFYKTPECKVQNWIVELRRLRDIILSTGLKEELKWSAPCYTYNGKNILMLSALKEYCVIGFFKGSLLDDPDGALVSPGKSSQADRRLVFQSIDEVESQVEIIRKYVLNAIEVEKSGKKVEFKKNLEPIPIELEEKFIELPKLKEAFYALTPGRQRGYILHFSQPKQSKTRTSRIEKLIPKIMEGKGFHDR